MAGKPRQNDLLVMALAAGKSKPDAAREAGLSERSVYRRLKDAEFRQRVTEIRAEMVGQTVGLLASAAEAAQTLQGLLTAASESVRLSAARAILELGTKLRESVELEDRIAAIEERVAASLRSRDDAPHTAMR